jgi:hypothetical protein
MSFVFFQKKSEKNENTGFTMFWEREGEAKFRTLFGRLKDVEENFFKYFRMSISKSEKPKQLLHTDIE